MKSRCCWFRRAHPGPDEITASGSSAGVAIEAQQHSTLLFVSHREDEFLPLLLQHAPASESLERREICLTATEDQGVERRIPHRYSDLEVHHASHNGVVIRNAATQHILAERAISSAFPQLR